MNNIHKIILWLAAAATFIFCCIIASGCKTVQTQERVVYRDSITVRVVHDTIRETIHDTLFVQVQQNTKTDEGTIIQFADSGGSYNSQTGEATGVKSVHEQKQTEQNTNLQLEWQHTAEAYKATADSLQMQLTDLKKKTNHLNKQPHLTNGIAF